MSRPHLRPHFDLVVDLPPDAVMARLAEQFERAQSQWVGHTTGHHGQLVVPESSRHMWSPWLTFSATPHDRGTLLTGRFAPHPSVWTGYMAMYGMVIFTMLGLAFFALSQWMAGEAATMLWGLPIGAVLLVLLYGSAFIGQNWTAEQMRAMRDFVLGCFDDGQARWA